MQQRMKCKEDGCKEEVVYEYRPLIAFSTIRELVQREETVYLTCPNEHTHRYNVPVGG